ncbi:MAG: hypothetical protein ACI9L9_000400, partial [Marivirga sp.]
PLITSRLDSKYSVEKSKKSIKTQKSHYRLVTGLLINL